jgi:AraC family transcriptional regulator
MKKRDSIEARLLRQEYISRINKVIDYIEKNLDGELNLSMLAGVANFSRFHFHRIFSAMVGETLNDFIRRLRLERAAIMIIDNPKYSITEIALMCGFTSPAVFSRAFKDYFHISASELRESGLEGYSKIRQLKSKEGKIYRNYNQKGETSGGYLAADIKPIKKRRLIMNVQIREMPEMHVAYCRHIGSYSDCGKAFEKLFRWAGPRGLINDRTKVLAVYHDDPEITEESKLRTSACITISPDIKVEGEIGKMTVAGGKYACGYFEISEPDFSNAWDAMMGEWLPESGYQPDDRLPFELYYDHPKESKGKFVFDICIPVKPL